MRISQTVEQVLRDHPATRNSDKLLLIEVWAELGLNLTPPQEDMLLDLPPVESIRRVRQKIQEKGLYLADESVRHARHHKSLRMQQITPQAPPKYIDQVLNEPVQGQLI